MGATPSGLIRDPSLNTPPPFTPDALLAATLPLYPGLGQASNMLNCIASGVVLFSMFMGIIFQSADIDTSGKNWSVFEVTSAQRTCRVPVWFAHLCVVFNLFMYMYACTVGTLWLAVACRHWQPVVFAANDVSAAGVGDSMRHQRDTVERGVVYVQRANNSGRPGGNDPTDDHSGVVVVGTSSQAVAWLGRVRAGGGGALFDGQCFVADTWMPAVVDLASHRIRHDNRHCVTSSLGVDTAAVSRCQCDVHCDTYTTSDDVLRSLVDTHSRSVIVIKHDWRSRVGSGHRYNKDFCASLPWQTVGMWHYK